MAVELFADIPALQVVEELVFSQDRFNSVLWRNTPSFRSVNLLSASTAATAVDTSVVESVGVGKVRPPEVAKYSAKAVAATIAKSVGDGE